MGKASSTIWKYCLTALAFTAIINAGESFGQTSNLPSSENPYTYPNDFGVDSKDFVPVYLFFTGSSGKPGQNGAPIDFYIESLPATTGEIYDWYIGAQSQGGNGDKGSGGTINHATGREGGAGGNGGEVNVYLGSADIYDISNQIQIQTSQATESGGSYVVGAIASIVGGNGGKGGSSYSLINLDTASRLREPTHLNPGGILASIWMFTSATPLRFMPTLEPNWPLAPRAPSTTAAASAGSSEASLY